MPRRANPLQGIEARQRVEDHVAKFKIIAAEEGRATLRNRWEHSTEKKIDGRSLNRAMDVAQARHDQLLVARRKRLAELLKTERAEHELMLERLAVTDDERRERLFQKARDLRAERERLRKEEAQRQEDRRFRDQAAPVRLAQSRIKVLHVAADRQSQLEENMRRKEDAAAEDRFWAEQQREEVAERCRRSQKDLQQLHARAQQTRADLAEQISHQQATKSSELASRRAEEEAFRDEIIERDRLEAEEEVLKKQQQRIAADKTKLDNLGVRSIKEAAVAAEKAEDKAHLDRLLADIAADEKKEHERRIRVREESKRRKAEVELQMARQAESETAQDRLWEEENNRQWNRREEQWAREQRQREALHASVMGSRRDQVLANRQADKDATEATRAEHMRLREEEQSMVDADALNAARRRADAKAVQDHQMMQAAARQAEKDDIRRSKKTELTDAQAAEKRYEEKIKVELQRLDEARPPPYSNVKLTKTSRGIRGLWQ